MVVEAIDTVVAGGTVGDSRGAVDEAGGAELELEGVRLDGDGDGAAFLLLAGDVEQVLVRLIVFALGVERMVVILI